MKKRILLLLTLLIVVFALAGCGNKVSKSDYDKYLVLESTFQYEADYYNNSVDLYIPASNPSNKNVSYKIDIVAYDKNEKEVGEAEATGVAFKNSHKTIKVHMKINNGLSINNIPDFNYEITELKLTDDDK